MTELREKVARVIDSAGFDDRSDVPGLRHEQALDDRAEEALTKADAILNLIGADGWKLVPVEPTEEMCAAFLEAEDASIMMDPIGAFEDAYRAMIAASPPPPVTP